MFPLGSECLLFFYTWLLTGLHVLIIEVGYPSFAADRKLRYPDWLCHFNPSYFLHLLRRSACGWCVFLEQGRHLEFS